MNYADTSEADAGLILDLMGMDDGELFSFADGLAAHDLAGLANDFGRLESAFADLGNDVAGELAGFDDDENDLGVLLRRNPRPAPPTAAELRKLAKPGESLNATRRRVAGERIRADMAQRSKAQQNRAAEFRKRMSTAKPRPKPLALPAALAPAAAFGPLPFVGTPAAPMLPARPKPLPASPSRVLLAKPRANWAKCQCGRVKNALRRKQRAKPANAAPMAPGMFAAPDAPPPSSAFVTPLGQGASGNPGLSWMAPAYGGFNGTGLAGFDDAREVSGLGFFKAIGRAFKKVAKKVGAIARPLVNFIPVVGPAMGTVLDLVAPQGAPKSAAPVNTGPARPAAARPAGLVAGNASTAGNSASSTPLLIGAGVLALFMLSSRR